MRARAAAFLDARRAFEIRGRTRRAEQRAEEDRRRVGHERARQASHLALDEEPGAARHAHQRARRIEQFDEKEDQHDIEEAVFDGAFHVEREEGRLDRRRQRRRCR